MIVPGKRPRLFLNDGRGHFRDATAGSGLDLLPEMEASGGVAADVDGDGLPDLFLTNHVSPCRMLKNLGHGKFRDVTAAWGLAGLSAPYTSAVFFDADRDGRVDLFVACYGDARTSGPAYDGSQRRGRPLLPERATGRPSLLRGRDGRLGPRRHGLGIRGVRLRRGRRRRRRPLRRERLRGQLRSSRTARRRAARGS